MVKHKKTRLIEAVASGDISMVEKLLKDSVSPDASNSAGISVLMVAAKIDRVDIVKLLIHYGANVDNRDFIGRTAFSHALKYNSKNALIALLDSVVRS